MKATIILGVIMAGSLIVGWQASPGDDDDDWAIGSFFERPPGVAPVTNPQYIDECGSCHMAYQPGLLPARSWQKIMGGLADHFGDNAELDPDVLVGLTAYLVDNSADMAITSAFSSPAAWMKRVAGTSTPRS